METKNSNPLISVVVSTYNRAGLLEKCLNSLVAQTIDPTRYEVIIVNNCSTDNTQNIADSFVNFQPNFHLVIEHHLGASFARNRGITEAKGAYIAFIDGDALAEPDWLMQAESTIERYHADMFGGPVFPYYEGKKPKWFKDEYEIRLAAKDSGPLPINVYLAGSNMIIKRSLLQQIGGFATSLGPIGDTFSYGEDTELLIRARKEYADCTFYYNTLLRVKHLVPNRKMRIRYFVKSKFQIGTCSSLIFGVKKENKFLILITMIRHLLVIIIHLTINMHFRDRSSMQFWQNYFVERVSPLFNVLGRCYAVLLR